MSEETKALTEVLPDIIMIFVNAGLVLFWFYALIQFFAARQKEVE